MEDNSVFKIPSYARQEADTFAVPKENELFLELSTISEEIMLCRQQALKNY